MKSGTYTCLWLALLVFNIRKVIHLLINKLVCLCIFHGGELHLRSLSHLQLWIQLALLSFLWAWGLPRLHLAGDENRNNLLCSPDTPLGPCVFNDNLFNTFLNCWDRFCCTSATHEVWSGSANGKCVQGMCVWNGLVCHPATNHLAFKGAQELICTRSHGCTILSHGSGVVNGSKLIWHWCSGNVDSSRSITSLDFLILGSGPMRGLLSGVMEYSWNLWVLRNHILSLVMINHLVFSYSYVKHNSKKRWKFMEHSAEMFVKNQYVSHSY